MSDLELHRPIWFGGDDRSEASMDAFYRFGGESDAAIRHVAELGQGWNDFDQLPDRLDELAETIVEPARDL